MATIKDDNDVDDEFNFEGEEVTATKRTTNRKESNNRKESTNSSTNSSIASGLSAASSTAAIAPSTAGRTKRQRLKLKQTEREAEWKSKLDDGLFSDVANKKSVRFSFDPSKKQRSCSSLLSGRRRRKTSNSSQESSSSSNEDSRNAYGRSGRSRSNPSLSRSSRSSSSSLSPRSSSSSSFLLTSPDVVKAVRGAGQNVYSVQDAGQYRMFCDEINDLCGTIVSSANSTEAACQLAWILASNSTTKVNLLGSMETLSASQTASNALESILEVFARIPAPSELNLGIKFPGSEDFNNGFEESNDDDSFNNAEYGFSASQDSQLSMSSTSDTAAATLDPTKMSRNGQTAASPRGMENLQPVGWDALGAALHYLSFHCTLRNKLSPLKVRYAILANKGAVQGICNLILREKTVREVLLDGDQKQPAAIDDMLVSSSNSIDEDEEDDKSAISVASTATGSSSSKTAGDPTSAGRRRRKKRRVAKPAAASSLDPIDEDEEITNNNDTGRSNKTPAVAKLSFTSDEVSVSTFDSTRERIQELSGKVFDEILEDHSLLALNALNRIIQGKDESDERSCVEDSTENDNPMASQDDDDEDDDQEVDTSNPLVVTNSLLQRSDALPTLSTAMAETLAALLKLQEKEDSLFTRVQLLAEILNNACLMNDDNREDVCRNGKLIASILALLNDHSSERYEAMLVASGLLTSITHENEVAAEQMLGSYKFDDALSKNTKKSGLEIMTGLLFDLVKLQKFNQSGSDEFSKHRYDLIIFCLTTLTNTLEEADIAVALSKLKTGGGDEHFLEWVTQWIVDQTEPFREKVMSASSNTTASSNNADDFDETWKENLNTAGNGCIFLACVLTADLIVGDELQIIQQQIFQHSPKALIINTAKAYCNFYHFFMGVLTHEVVTAVKKLLEKLENVET